MPTTITETNLPHPVRRGKVRDIYDLSDHLLLVATDRISAFDVVLPNGIPDKGAVLAQISAFWFQKTAHFAPSHFVAMGYEREKLLALELPKEVRELPPEVARRSMVVRKAERIPIECVVRGYITGSAWAEYKSKGTVNGVNMPTGLRESQAFPEPLFTPTTKADVGHDQPVSFDQMAAMVGQTTATEVRKRSIAVYEFARREAGKRGIIIADTKFEFGYIDGRISLIDELLTPDSSRFWLADTYRVGRPQDSYDKQPVRDWLVKTGWNKEPPTPALPPEVVEQTAARYCEVFRRLTALELR